MKQWKTGVSYFNEYEIILDLSEAMLTFYSYNVNYWSNDYTYDYLTCLPSLEFGSHSKTPFLKYEDPDLLAIFVGILPNIRSIIARCSRLLWVSNSM